MTIPIVFWLVLVSAACGQAGAGGSGCGVDTDIMPYPFGSAMDCDIAGVQFTAGQDKMRYRCLQQRVSDIEVLRNDNGTTGWRKYPQAPK